MRTGVIRLFQKPKTWVIIFGTATVGYWRSQRHAPKNLAIDLDQTLIVSKHRSFSEAECNRPPPINKWWFSPLWRHSGVNKKTEKLLQVADGTLHDGASGTSNPADAKVDVNDNVRADADISEGAN